MGNPTFRGIKLCNHPAASEVELTNHQYLVLETSTQDMNSYTQVIHQLESSYIAAMPESGKSLLVRRNCKDAFSQITPQPELPITKPNPNRYFPDARFSLAMITVSLTSVIFKNQFYGFLSMLMQPLSDIFGHSSFMC